VNIADVQMISSAGDEEVRGSGVICDEAFSACLVLRQHRLGRRMNRHQTGFPELRAANRQQALLQIDIVDLQANGLTNPQASDTEQAEQTVKRPGAQAIARRKVQSTTKQARDFLV